MCLRLCGHDRNMESLKGRTKADLIRTSFFVAIIDLTPMSSSPSHINNQGVIQ